MLPSTSHPRTTEEFFHALSPDCKRIVVAMRDVIRTTVPGIAETVLWGTLYFYRADGGGKIKGAVCLINVKQDRVKLEFIHGVHLADPKKLLSGNLKSKRAVIIDSIGDTRRPAVVALIKSAASIRWE